MVRSGSNRSKSEGKASPSRERERRRRSRSRSRDHRRRSTSRRSRRSRRRSRSRGRSPLRHEKSSYDNMEIPETKPLSEWSLTFEERPAARRETERLDRHSGAKRETKPAWMTKGVGVGEKMFGEPVGIIKPGDDKPKQEAPAHDPMGDVYRSALAGDLSPARRSRRRSRRSRSRSRSRRRRSRSHRRRSTSRRRRSASHRRRSPSRRRSVSNKRSRSRSGSRQRQRSASPSPEKPKDMITL